MTISIIVAPSADRQVHRPCLPTKRPRTRPPESIGDRILEAVVQNGLNPTSRWELVETLAPDDGTVRRTELRRLRSEVLRKIDALVRAGALVRSGRWNIRLQAGRGGTFNHR